MVFLCVWLVGFLVSFLLFFCFVLLLRVRGDTEKTDADGENVCLVNVSSVARGFPCLIFAKLERK